MDGRPYRCSSQACCLTCSVKDRAWWQRAPSRKVALSPPTKFSQSMTSVTCHQKWSTLSNAPAGGKRAGHDGFSVGCERNDGFGSQYQASRAVTGEIGQLALCLALALSLVQACSGLWGAREAASLSRDVAFSSAIGFFVFVALAFGALMFGYVTSDFSILNVAQNSHTLKPLLYKITGVWGNHEGSMLLWVMVLAVYTVFIALAKRG